MRPATSVFQRRRGLHAALSLRTKTRTVDLRRTQTRVSEGPPAAFPASQPGDHKLQPHVWKGNVTYHLSCSLCPLNRLHFFLPPGGGGEAAKVPDPGGEQLCIPWRAALHPLLARRSGQFEVLRGQPAVALNLLPSFLHRERLIRGIPGLL